MPYFAAISAALTGSISPQLFIPSVRRITTLLLASLSLMRATAFASPIPIAVPSSMMPFFTCVIRLTRVLRSVVRGHCVKLSPANSTMPIRSFSRACMNSQATFLAASRRLGLKSQASIEPEISIDMMMSMPSFSTVSSSDVLCGRAIAIIINEMIKKFNTGGSHANILRSVSLLAPKSSNVPNFIVALKFLSLK